MVPGTAAARVPQPRRGRRSRKTRLQLDRLCPPDNRGNQSWLEAGHPSAVGPWRRPRLTPNPALALKDGRLAILFGSPGGDVQCQAMLQSFLNMAVFAMDPQEAIEAPRFFSASFPNSFYPHKAEPGVL